MNIKNIETMRSEPRRWIDDHFSNFIGSIEGDSCELVSLLAAETSAELGNGQIFLDLSALPDYSRLRDYCISHYGSFDPNTIRNRILLHPAVCEASDVKLGGYLVADQNKVYLARYFAYQRYVLESIRSRLRVSPFFCEQLTPHTFSSLFCGQEDAIQRAAVALCLRNQFMLISGGPGTGKTSIIAKIIVGWIEQSLLAIRSGQDATLHSPDDILLCAPTGKAALRLESVMEEMLSTKLHSEEVQAIFPRKVLTIHRALGISSNGLSVRHHRGYKLPAKIVVIDEASMLDLGLAVRLFEALDKDASLILVGDKDQLPPVEPGSLIGQLSKLSSSCGNNCWSTEQIKYLEEIHHQDYFAYQTETDSDGGKVTINADADFVCILQNNYRFKDGSNLARLASAIKDGSLVWGDLSFQPEVTFIDASNCRPEILSDIFIAGYAPYLHLVNEGTADIRIFQAFDRFRVLCAVREGLWGIGSISALIEDALMRVNLIPDHVSMKGDQWQFPNERAPHYPGKPILITRNDYNLNLANGDIGICVYPNHSGSRSNHKTSLNVIFPRSTPNFPILESNISIAENVVTHRASLIHSQEASYALTVHKAQGSEFTDVILILPDTPSPLLSRELLYTAATRAKQKLAIVGTNEIFNYALRRTSL